MKKVSKRLESIQKQIDKNKLYSLEEAFTQAINLATAKFDESLDVAFQLGVDPKHADQMVRGSIVLPNGTGKKVKIVVLTSGENIKKAEQANAA